MPQIVKKRPYSDIEIDFSKSRTPAELGSEFGLALSPLDVGRGIIMLVSMVVTMNLILCMKGI